MGSVRAGSEQEQNEKDSRESVSAVRFHDEIAQDQCEGGKKQMKIAGTMRDEEVMQNTLFAVPLKATETVLKKDEDEQEPKDQEEKATVGQAEQQSHHAEGCESGEELETPVVVHGTEKQFEEMVRNPFLVGTVNRESSQRVQNSFRVESEHPQARGFLDTKGKTEASHGL
jgi:hypothetical protein